MAFRQLSGIVALESGTTAYLPENCLNFGNLKLVVGAAMSQATAKRRRGMILSPQGWQRLRDAIRAAEEQEQYGERFTQEELAIRTQLDPGTVAKILQREKGSDKGKLEQFFQAFDLELQADDYTLPRSTPDNADLTDSAAVTSQNRVDWGEAVDVSIFYGRVEELGFFWVLGVDSIMGYS
jgi:transcriptional regulator with XRE-family HTH domain